MLPRWFVVLLKLALTVDNFLVFSKSPCLPSEVPLSPPGVLALAKQWLAILRDGCSSQSWVEALMTDGSSPPPERAFSSSRGPAPLSRDVVLTTRDSSPPPEPEGEASTIGDSVWPQEDEALMTGGSARLLEDEASTTGGSIQTCSSFSSAPLFFLPGVRVSVKVY